MATRKSSASSTRGCGTALPGAAVKRRIAVKRTPAQVERKAVRENITAATAADLDALDAMLASHAPEDAQALARALFNRHRVRDARTITDANEVLTDDWRTGGYPYRNLLSRKSYERQKCPRPAKSCSVIAPGTTGAGSNA